jgi:hypothetical protein
MTTVRVTRIDPKVMLRFSLLLAGCLWLMVMVAAVLVWVVAAVTGTLSNFEDLLAELLAEGSFRLEPSKLLLGSAGLAIVLFGTSAVLSGVLSALFNLIAGRIGGLKLGVAEEIEEIDES